MTHSRLIATESRRTGATVDGKLANPEIRIPHPGAKAGGPPNPHPVRS
jgi:hypothetical protein